MSVLGRRAGNVAIHNLSKLLNCVKYYKNIDYEQPSLPGLLLIIFFICLAAGLGSLVSDNARLAAACCAFLMLVLSASHD